MPDPSCSVIVPTFNRRQRLARVLGALERQRVDHGTFEVIVVDDGSTDGTLPWLRGLHFSYRLRSLTQENGGPSVARNTGVAHASGELLLFLDDDVEPMPELLEEHFRSHRAESSDVVVLGPLSSLPQYAHPWETWQQERLEKQYREMIQGDSEPTYRTFWTGNASVKRVHVVGAGGFDPAFHRGEDVELGYRLSLRGLLFRFNPLARGLHHAERSFESFVATHRSYGAIDAEIYGRLGRGELIRVLSNDFGTLHPATRALVRACVGNPGRRKQATRVLGSWLNTRLANLARPLSYKACGALANLVYWESAETRLGRLLTEEILERGEQHARRGVF